MNLTGLEAFLAPNKTIKRERSRKKLVGSTFIKDLVLDLNTPPADQVLPCSIEDQAANLNWSKLDVKRFNTSSAIYTTLPMICQGADCFWASQCPTRPNFAFKDRPCPILINRAYVRFVSLITELNVNPDDTVDIDVVLDLVRIEVQLAICDMQLSLEGMLVSNFVVSPRSGELLNAGRNLHPLLQHQRDLRKARDANYKSLSASRIEKQRSTAVSAQTQLNVLDAMDMLSKAARDAPDSGKVIIDSIENLPALSPPEEDEELFFVGN